MSKKFGSEKFDKWDRQLNKWEDSEFFYSQEDYDDYSDNTEEENDNESREYPRD